MLTLDPDNTVLAEAVEALETTILARVDPDRDGWLATYRIEALQILQFLRPHHPPYR
jgi:hypothetical protein